MSVEVYNCVRRKKPGQKGRGEKDLDIINNIHYLVLRIFFRLTRNGEVPFLQNHNIRVIYVVLKILRRPWLIT